MTAGVDVNGRPSLVKDCQRGRQNTRNAIYVVRQIGYQAFRVEMASKHNTLASPAAVMPSAAHTAYAN